jgi:hypothetical protein
MGPVKLKTGPKKSQIDPNKLKKIMLISAGIIGLIIIVLFVFINIFNGNTSKKNNASNNNTQGNTARNNIASQYIESSDDTPKIRTNGEYYDYSKIDIRPTITILPAKILDTITEIKGSVVSNTLANDDYNNNYVIYSGTDKATVITPDMIPNFNTKDTPTKTIEFIWTDINSGKCYIPEYLDRNHDKIVLGECSGNNANYSWEDGFIRHVNSNRYIQTWNNEDLPTENDGLLLSKIDNLSEEKKLQRRKFDFIQSGNNLSNAKIIHQYSEKCVFPNVGTNGKVLLSISSAAC